MVKKTLIPFIFLLISTLVSAQMVKDEKRIYLFDVTASMEGKGSVDTPNIFANVKKQLAQAVDGITNQNTEVVIIPFTDKPHGVIKNTIDNKDELLSEIDKITVKRGDTNIADAWLSGIQEVDTTKVNYLFMVTDGLHNCGPEKEVLYERLKEWGEISKGKYLFAFYVMLTPYAKELEIANIVEETEQMWLIESMDVNVSFINSGLTLTTNVNNSKTVRINFSSNYPKIFDRNIEIELQLEDNSYYALTNLKSVFGLRYVEFDIEELRPKIEIPLEVLLNLRIRFNKENFPLVFFTPDNVSFNIVNKGIREMTIKEHVR